MYFDLTGKWDQFALCKNRSQITRERFENYITGWKKFCLDLLFLFLPCMAFCFWYNAAALSNSSDPVNVSVLKLVSGYLLGKVWAFAVHFALHFPSLYWIHRRHHRSPKNLVASAAWEDSYIEYAIMELPSLAIAVLLFPTHFRYQLIHFAWHGWDGACGHSGFSAPGFLGFCFDGEYHYHHHALLTVNYAEIEVIDKFFGTHHTQRSHATKSR